jgi:hypothetical protein
MFSPALSGLTSQLQNIMSFYRIIFVYIQLLRVDSTCYRTCKEIRLVILWKCTVLQNYREFRVRAMFLATLSGLDNIMPFYS